MIFINGGSQTYIDVAIIDMGEHLAGFDRIKKTSRRYRHEEIPNPYLFASPDWNRGRL